MAENWQVIAQEEVAKLINERDVFKDAFLKLMGGDCSNCDNPILSKALEEIT